jgi:hypothetical protein
MLRSIVITAIFASLAFPALANDGVELSLKSKALASAGAPIAKHGVAPFTAARDPLPELVLLDEQEQRGRSGACELTAKDLCYDLADRRVVYRPARQYMPKVEGLTAENVSLRRNRIVFKYSFK